MRMDELAWQFPHRWPSISARVVLEENVGEPKRTVIASGTGWSFQRQAAGYLDALSGHAAPMTSGKDGLRDLELSERIWRRIQEVR